MKAVLHDAFHQLNLYRCYGTSFFFDLLNQFIISFLKFESFLYEGWNFNSGNYLFTTDTK